MLAGLAAVASRREDAVTRLNGTLVKRHVALLISALALAGLGGCGKFFQQVTPTAPTGGTGSSTAGCTDCIFLGNSLDDLNSYALSSAGALTAATSENLGYAANTIAVNPKFPYVYVGSALNQSIFSYSISTSGVLTAANSGSYLSNAASPIAMATNPAGTYLYILNEGAVCPTNSADTCLSISSLALDTANGGVASSASLQTVPVEVRANDAVARQILVSPDGTTVYAALGTGGIAVFGVTSGALNSSGTLVATDTSGLTSVNGIALDSTGTYLYAGLSGPSGGLAVFTTSGGLAAVTGSPFTISGDQNSPSDYAVAVSGNYVYVSNSIEGTITGYTTASLTAATSSTPAPLTGSPYPSSSLSGTSNTTALVADSSGDYIVALNTLGSPDVQVFSIGSDGSLTAGATANTGANNATGGPTAIAASFTGT